MTARTVKTVEYTVGPQPRKKKVLTPEEAHEKDLKTLGEHLLKVATDNDLCGLFWQEVDAVNKKLTKKLNISRPKSTYKAVLSVSFYGKANLNKEDNYYGYPNFADPKDEAAIETAVYDALKKLGMTLDRTDIEILELEALD